MPAYEVKNKRKCVLRPHSSVAIATGLALEIARGYLASVEAPLRFKFGGVRLRVTIGKQLLDSSTVEELVLTVHNHSDRIHAIQKSEDLAVVRLISDERPDRDFGLRTDSTLSDRTCCLEGILRHQEVLNAAKAGNGEGYSAEAEAPEPLMPKADTSSVQANASSIDPNCWYQPFRCSTTK